MNEGHSIEHPHGAVEDCGQVRVRLEILHGLALHNLSEGGAVGFWLISRFSNEKMQL